MGPWRAREWKLDPDSGELKKRGDKGQVDMQQGIANADFLRVAGKDAQGMLFPVPPVLVAEQLPASNPVRAVALNDTSRYEAKHGAGSRNLFGATVWDAYLLLDKAVPKAQCDSAIEAQLQWLHITDLSPAKGKRRGNARNAPKFDLQARLFQMCGVDLTRIDGIDVTTALVVLAEIGPDMSKFPSDKHFASWLGLCPGTKITGGKVMSGKTKRCANRAAQALRLAAAALRTSQSALGAYFRRLCSRMDKPKAVTAAAHKLARLIYAMLTKGQEYTDQGQDYYEERYRQRVLHNLARRAQQMGMALVPVVAQPTQPA